VPQPHSAFVAACASVPALVSFARSFIWSYRAAG
jgi:hypothetical protein